MRHLTLLLTASALSLTLSGCGSTLNKLNSIGEKPPLTKVENPQVRPDYKPLSWPLPDPEGNAQHTSNSLWQPGSRGFFRDQRAARVGDILRINVVVADQARIDNNNNTSRTTSDTSSASALFGYERQLGKLTPFTGGTDPTALIGTSGNLNLSSTGRIDRRETVNTQVAALVTQVLPNGNLVIEGSQEILVNYEVREVSVKGVIRPEDITSNNTVDSSQIAQARIVYSGRGQLSTASQPRWGQQVIEAISPF
ncbi:MAG: flagellar basal body L-ring protein FlgH [Rickettsiales bacterium]